MSEKTATKRLIALLNERGVEWDNRDGSEVLRTHWEIDGTSFTFTESRHNGITTFEAYSRVNPEQVVAATLGGGECVMEYGGDVAEVTARAMDVYFCSECGSPNYNDCMPHYCIYCGKAVKR